MVQVTVSDKILDPPMSIRVKFQKTGDMQYISHLDLVRTMTRVLLRARLPLWYSEGFNPRPRLTFATPMSVGAQSVCEYLDIRINKNVDPDKVKEALNANLSENIKVSDVYFPDSKFSDIAYSSYKITIVTKNADATLCDKVNKLLSARPITVFKKSKSGDRDTDISPQLFSADARMDGKSIVISCTLMADNNNFLNPEYIVTYLKNNTGMLSSSLADEHYDIMRTGVYFSDMREFR